MNAEAPPPQRTWPWSLDESYQRALANSFPRDASDEARQALYADLKLQYDYPYEFVLFYDTWSEGDHGQLTRTILAHGNDPAPLQEAYRQFPERAKLLLDYVEGPDDEPHLGFMDESPTEDE
jgi:hypothetical protein